MALFTVLKKHRFIEKAGAVRDHYGPVYPETH
jgi:hypothetical protein